MWNTYTASLVPYPAHLALPAEQQDAIRLKQGRAIYGVDMTIVDGQGEELPWDGRAYGDLLVKGPWIVKAYFKGEGGDPLVDGWFPTGDVATIEGGGASPAQAPTRPWAACS